MKSRVLITSLLTLMVLLAGCQNEPRYFLLEETHEAMGTILSFTVYAETEEQGKAAITETVAEIQRINAVMSNWDAESELSRLNAAAGTGPVTVQKEILSLVVQAMEYAKKTSGKYDITSGPLTRLWGFLSRNKSSRPNDEQINEVLQSIGYERVLVDQSSGTIAFMAPGMELDLGSIAKGYAVDKAIEILKRHEIHAALINLGGNIGTIGLPPRKGQWIIGIRDPRKAHGLLGTLTIDENFKDWSLASSGQYERYFVFDGVRYGHIVDPVTGYPIDGILGTTVLAGKAVTADVLSTATFVSPEETALKLIEEKSDVFGLILNKDEVFNTYYLLISSELKPFFNLSEDNDDLEVRLF